MSNPRSPAAAAGKRLLDAILRNHLRSFIAKVFGQLDPGTTYSANWHIDAIAWHLEQVRLGHIRRLIIAMPPRSLKSIAASVAFPAFVHGHQPERRLICVSYASDLATKLHNDYRTVIRSPWYRDLFARTQISRDADSETQLTARGGRMATSVGGVLTGRGADIIVIDDPLKASDAASALRREAVNDWYRSTLISRLNNKTTGAIVIVTQRLHLDDLVGYVLSTGEEWTVLELPAIAGADLQIQVGDDRWHMFGKGEALHPEREPLQTLDTLRRELGSDAFSAQYLQQPVPPGGSMFRRSWVCRYDRLPSLQAGDQIIQSWDTASKDGPANDWSVCSTWLRQGGHHYLVDLYRDRLDYPALRSRARALAARFKPTMVLIEDMGVGTALIAELRQAGVNVAPVRPALSKEARASIEAATFEGGRVFFPHHAPWLSELETELFAFPGSRHDDQVDSIAQALAYKPHTWARTSTAFIEPDGTVTPYRPRGMHK